MDRNQPLIGGRLELEGAQAFVRTAQQLERAMTQLNNTMKINAAEGVARRLTNIARSFDTIGAATKGAAKGLAAVNKQVESLGRRTKTIDNLAKSIAGLHIAQSAGIGKNVVRGGAGLTKATTDALIASLAAIAASGGGRGGGGGGGFSKPLASSKLDLTKEEAYKRSQIGAILDLEIASAKEVAATKKKLADGLIAEQKAALIKVDNDATALAEKNWKAERDNQAARLKAISDEAAAKAKAAEKTIKDLEKQAEKERKQQEKELKAREKEREKQYKDLAKEREKRYNADRKLYEKERKDAEKNRQDIIKQTNANLNKITKEEIKNAEKVAKEQRRIQATADKERERILKANENRERAANQRRILEMRRNRGPAFGGLFGGGRGGRGGAGAGAGAGGGGGGGLGIGSTAYFRNNIGPAAIYTRLPLTLTGIGAAAVVASAGVLSLAAAFAKVVTSAKVFGGLETPAEIKRLSDGALEFSRNFSTGADEFVRAATVLGKAGAPIKGVNNELVRTTALFAAASDGELEAEEAARILTQTIKSQNLAWSEAGNVADTFTGVVQNSSLQFGDLDNILTQLLPVATELGYTYKDAAVATALLTDRGLSAAVATTALKNTFLRLADPTKESLKIMDKYGISLFDANEKALPLPEVIGRITAAFSKNGAQGTADAQEFFDMVDLGTTRTILSLSNLSRAGVDAFNELSARAKVSTERIARELDQTLVKQLEIVGNQLEAAGIKIGTNLEQTFFNIAFNINEALRGIGLDGFAELGQSISRVIRLQDDFAASLFRALNPGVTAVIKAVADAISDIGKESDVVKGAILNMATALSNGALLAVVIFNQVKKAIGDTDEASAQFATNEAARQLKLRREALETAVFIASIPIAIGRFYGQRMNNRVGGAPNTLVGPNGETITNPSSYEFPVDEFSTIMAQLKTEFEVALGVVDSGSKSTVGGVVETVRGATNPIIDLIRNVRQEYQSLQAELSAGAAQAQADWQRTATFGPMPTSMGFWDEGIVPRLTVPTRRVVPPFIPSGGSTLPSAGGGGGGGGPDLDEITAQVKALLSDVPGLTDELFRFIAGLAQDVPARLMPMVNAIKDSREEVGGLLTAKRGLMAIDFQLMVSARRLGQLQGQQGKLEIEQAIAVIGYDKQLLGLRQQVLELDAQMAPLRERLLGIDREMSKLQEENLVLARQRIQTEIDMVPIQLELEKIERRISDLDAVDFATARARLNLDIAMLPLRQRIEDIEKRIGEVNKKNFELSRERLNLELAGLPIRIRIREIEDQITDSVDRRAGFYRELKDLDLADIEDALEAAWAKMDVPTILDLEKQKAALEEQLKGDDKGERAVRRRQIALELEKVTLEDSLKPLDRRLQAISDTEEKQRILNDLIILGLEQELDSLKKLLTPYEDRALRMDQEAARRELLNALMRLGLDEEKARLEKLLRPMQDKLDAINREIAAEQQRNALLITHLEEERRKLQEQLIPLEDQRRAIERIIAEVDLLRARASLEFEERKIGLQAMILQEQLRQAELEATRAEQELLFAGLVQGFIDALIGSQAFSAEEALEVAKRGKLWDDQVADLIEIKVEFDRVTAAALLYKNQLDAIDKNITITITTVHKTVYEGGTGTGSGAGGTTSSGNEPAVTNQAMRVGQASGNVNISHNNEFNVAANYSQTQSPATITQDLRAMIMASRN